MAPLGAFCTFAAHDALAQDKQPAVRSRCGSWAELRRMRAGYPETEKTAACITLYLAFCMFVYGLFGFSFYKMLQPRHIAKWGWLTERLAYIGPMLIEEDASYETFDETTVASSSRSNRLGTEAGHN
jgi:hypothetical protein